MSVPISAIRSWAFFTPKPGICVELGDLPLVRLAQDGDLLVQHGDLGAVVVDVVQHHRQDEGVLGGEERAVQGIPQPGKLTAHHAAGHLREHPGLRSPR